MLPRKTNIDRLGSITVRRKLDDGPWDDIQRVRYTYYCGYEPHGSAGDLKTAVQQVLSGTAWIDGNTCYYRYYRSGEDHGFEHGLKFVLEPHAFAKLAADPDVSDPFAAADGKVAEYACSHFEYDSECRVVKEVVFGGSQEYTYAYQENSSDPDYNQWSCRTVEALPDGSQQIVYTNHLGSVLLTDHQSGQDHWIQYSRYDDNGRVILEASPSAVDSYVDNGGTSHTDLVVTLRENEGAIQLHEFGTETTTSTGGYAVAGYLQYEKVQRGSAGSPILLQEFRYTEHSAGGVTIYPSAAEITHASDDGTHPIVTSYSYPDWHPDTLQVRERVITRPSIPTEQNGPGTSATRVEQFDVYGRLVWLKDERGFVTHDQYDAASGALAQVIQDADGTRLGLPAGWTTPAGGGLHAISDFESDDRGRATQVLGPVHDVDGVSVRTAQWLVYRDVQHEVWAARGYATGSAGSYSYTLVNPVSISKQDAKGREIEAIQAVRASTAGRLSESDSFPQSSYCRWSVNSYRKNRLQWSRAYHAIPASGVGELGTNYVQIDYGYDAMGRHNRVRTPGGTITRTVFDVRSKPAEIYVGTDDVADDVVVEQYQVDYDAAGKPLFGSIWRRMENATGTGPLQSPIGSQPIAWASYQAFWYDGAGRMTALANYGTAEGLGAPTRPQAAPDRTADVLVTTIGYNDRGEAYSSVDPGGVETRVAFDDLGRPIRLVRNYCENSSSPDANVTTEATYNADGKILTLIAKNETTGDQITRYAYGTTPADSGVARTDLLRAEIYPDSDDTASPLGDGADGVYDRIEYKYSRLGEPTEVMDQNGAVHAYDYDGLGRPVQDRVTTSSSVDPLVLRIATSFEVRGLPATITSYNSPIVGTGSVVNQVKLEYNAFGLLATEYQEHAGSVNTSTSPKVTYTYTDGADNHARRTGMTYPNGRILRYEYSSGADDVLSRPSFLADDSSGSIGTHLAEYTDLGQSGITRADHPEPCLRCDLATGTGDDPHTGLNRFDRVVDLLWYDYGQPANRGNIGGRPGNTGMRRTSGSPGRRSWRTGWLRFWRPSG